MKRRWLWCALLASVAPCWFGCGGGPVLGDVSAEQGERLVTVETLTPKRVEIKRTSTQPATVHAYHTANIHAKVAGYVQTLHVDIGESVAANQVLAILSVPELVKQREACLARLERYTAEESRAVVQRNVASAQVDAQSAMVEQAIAEVAKADAGLLASSVERQRVSDLVTQRAVADRLLDESKQRYEAAQAEKTAATAKVASAQAQLSVTQSHVEAADADIKVAQSLTQVAHRELEQLDELIAYAELKAPFSGVIAVRNIDPGDLVRNSQQVSADNASPLLVVAQIDRVRVRVPVPERDAPLADIGDAARLEFQALPGEQFHGQISRISRSLDPQTRTMLVEIDLDNSTGKLLPGMFGQATVELASTSQQVVLPANAVRYDENGRSYVYVVDGNQQVQIVDVRTGWDDGQQVQIIEGLAGDERVIGPSLHRFQAGQKVQ